MKAFYTAMALMAAGTLGAAAPMCGTAFAQACCKICKAGKACGDTCIAKEHTCTKGQGCACNG